MTPPLSPLSPRRQWLPASALVLALVVAALVPSLPGGYDPLARMLSGVAWAVGRAALLLVPLGGLWLWCSLRSTTAVRPPRWLRGITVGVSVFAALVAVLLIFATSGSLLLAVGSGLVASVFMLRLVFRLRDAASGSPIGASASALLMFAPLVVLAAQLAAVDGLAPRARDRVIARSVPLIAEIEGYRMRHGAYPVSIFALYGDCKPGTMGVERYYYEASGDAYNLIFEEPSFGFGGRRFVVYNPRDRQRLTVHETDRLRLDDAGLDADNAGYTLVHLLPQPHWKLFTFRS